MGEWVAVGGVREWGDGMGGGACVLARLVGGREMEDRRRRWGRAGSSCSSQHLCGRACVCRGSERA